MLSTTETAMVRHHSTPSNEEPDSNLSAEAENLPARSCISEELARGRTSSLASYTTFDFNSIEVWEGRNFVKHPYGVEGRQYYLPANDDDEAKRQEIAHICWMAYNQLVLPRPQPGAFLDFGTGAGYWVQDVAQIFPDHKVIGIDLHYTDGLDAPGNSEFEVDDCEAEILPRSDPVSLISLRDSYFWVRDMSILIRRAQDVLQPGGYFQNQEFRLSHYECNKPKFTQWQQEVLMCAKRLGIQLHSAEEVHHAIKMAGFQDYRERTLTRLMRKRSHNRFFEFLELTLRATLRILVDGGTNTVSSTLKQLDEVREELQDENCQISIRMHSCWARK